MIPNFFCPVYMSVLLSLHSNQNRIETYMYTVTQYKVIRGSAYMCVISTTFTSIVIDQN